MDSTDGKDHKAAPPKKSKTKSGTKKIATVLPPTKSWNSVATTIDSFYGKPVTHPILTSNKAADGQETIEGQTEPPGYASIDDSNTDTREVLNANAPNKPKNSSNSALHTVEGEQGEGLKFGARNKIRATVVRDEQEEEATTSNSETVFNTDYRKLSRDKFFSHCKEISYGKPIAFINKQRKRKTSPGAIESYAIVLYLFVEGPAKPKIKVSINDEARFTGFEGPFMPEYFTFLCGEIKGKGTFLKSSEWNVFVESLRSCAYSMIIEMISSLSKVDYAAFFKCHCSALISWMCSDFDRRPSLMDIIQLQSTQNGFAYTTFNDFVAMLPKTQHHIYLSDVDYEPNKSGRCRQALLMPSALMDEFLRAVPRFASRRILDIRTEYCDVVGWLSTLTAEFAWVESVICCFSLEGNLIGLDVCRSTTDTSKCVIFIQEDNVFLTRLLELKEKRDDAETIVDDLAKALIMNRAISTKLLNANMRDTTILFADLCTRGLVLTKPKANLEVDEPGDYADSFRNFFADLTNSNHSTPITVSRRNAVTKLGEANASVASAYATAVDWTAALDPCTSERGATGKLDAGAAGKSDHGRAGKSTLNAVKIGLDSSSMLNATSTVHNSTMDRVESVSDSDVFNYVRCYNEKFPYKAKMNWPKPAHEVLSKWVVSKRGHVVGITKLKKYVVQDMVHEELDKLDSKKYEEVTRKE